MIIDHTHRLHKGITGGWSNKFKTVIGDNVFIGSGSMIVAPVSISRGVTTGAGSVITKDCPEDTLVLARARQTIIEGWIRPKKEDKNKA